MKWLSRCFRACLATLRMGREKVEQEEAALLTGNYTAHFTHTANPIYYTLHTALWILHTVHHTLHTLHYKLYKLYNAQCPQYIEDWTLWGTHFIIKLYLEYFTIQTCQCTLYTEKCTLKVYNTYVRLQSVHQTLYTAHITLHTRHAKKTIFLHRHGLSLKYFAQKVRKLRQI